MPSPLSLPSSDDAMMPGWRYGTGNPRGLCVVLPDIYGPSPFYHAVAQLLAAEGYEAVLLDYFFRQGELTDPSREGAFARRAGMDENHCLRDISAAIDSLASGRPGGRVGVLGFCLSGTFGWDLTTMRDDLAVASFYGFPEGPGGRVIAAAPRPIDVVEQFRAPMISFWGDRDHIPVELMERFGAAVRVHVPDYEQHIYPGAGHAFLQGLVEDRDDSEVARAAWKRTLRFLAATVTAGAGPDEAAVRAFVYEGLPSRVVFGAGTRRQVAAEVERLGRKRALVLSTPQQAGQAEEIRADLGPLAVGVFAEATMHTPAAVSEAATALVRELDADCVVAIGGGSTTGLGKAIALRTGIDQVVLPTTYAGSEVTPVLGETVDGRKTTQRNRVVLPETVIYDVELTTGLPVGLTVTSAINCVAHAVEALWAPEPNPVTSLMAAEAIRAILGSLPRIVAEPSDPVARAKAQYGAWLGGTCLATVGMGLHHKLCHVLGGAFDLPHAETHTVVLPYVVAYNSASSPAAIAVLKGVLGGQPAAALRGLTTGLGAPPSLRELGLPRSGVDTVVDQCFETAYANPRTPDRASLRSLLFAAWAGEKPDPDGYPAGRDSS